MGKKDRCAVFGCNNARLSTRNIQRSSLFAREALVNTERVTPPPTPPEQLIILLKSNKFNMAAVSLLTQARLMSVHSLDWILKKVYRGIRKCYVPQLESLLLIPHSVYYLNRSIPSICCCTAWKQVLYPRIEFWFLPCKRKWLWQNLSLCMPHCLHSSVLLLFLKRKQSRFLRKCKHMLCIVFYLPTQLLWDVHLSGGFTRLQL